MTGIEVEHFDGIPLARVVVDVDSANALKLREQLVACVPHGTDSLVIDLSPTRYLDSAGIDMLFRLHQRLHQRRGSLRVVIPPSSQLARLADIVALPHVVPVYETVADAIEAAGRDGASSQGVPGEGTGQSVPGGGSQGVHGGGGGQDVQSGGRSQDVQGESGS